MSLSISTTPLLMVPCGVRGHAVTYHPALAAEIDRQFDLVAMRKCLRLLGATSGSPWTGPRSPCWLGTTSDWMAVGQHRLPRGRPRRAASPRTATDCCMAHPLDRSWQFYPDSSPVNELIFAVRWRSISSVGGATC